MGFCFLSIWSFVKLRLFVGGLCAEFARVVGVVQLGRGCLQSQVGLRRPGSNRALGLGRVIRNTLDR